MLTVRLPVRVCIYLVLSAHFGIAWAQSPAESEIKSAYLYKICKFTEWPQKVDGNQPFVVSILGRLTPDNEIKIPPDKKINGRPVQVKKISSLEEIGDAEALFIAASEAKRLDAILAYTKSKYLLTFSDTKSFGDKGVIINFFTEAGTVKFDINQEAERKSLVRLPSQLFTMSASRVSR